MVTVVHITPQLPPAICGVGDYATVIGAQMQEIDPNIRCYYFAAGHRELVDRSPSGFWEHVRRVVASPTGGMKVVLHYSGYGYSVDGAPRWLAEVAKNRPNDIRLITIFHELYATGRPWQRAFWTSNFQKRTAIALARMSDELMTNRQRSAVWLEKVTHRSPGTVCSISVPSNVGEPRDRISWEKREPIAIAFGSTRLKQFAFQLLAGQTALCLSRLGISKVLNIGEDCSINLIPFHRHGIDVTHLGRLPAIEISEHLRQCRAGLLDYNLSFLDKSGVFAAFLAHGVTVVSPPYCFVGASQVCPQPKPLSFDLSVKQAADWSEQSPAHYAQRSSFCHARNIVNLIEAKKKTTNNPEYC